MAIYDEPALNGNIILSNVTLLQNTIHILTATSNSGVVLERVAEYFYYNHKYRNSENVPDMEIPAELCLELLMAADYLDS